MKELSKDRTPAEEAAVTNRGFRYYYEMRGDYVAGCSCRLSTICWMATSVWPAVPLQPCSIRCNALLSALASDLSRASGARLITGAMVYDWCYDQMKSSEKQAYIKEFIRLAKSMECGYPPTQ